MDTRQWILVYKNWMGHWTSIYWHNPLIFQVKSLKARAVNSNWQQRWREAAGSLHFVYFSLWPNLTGKIGLPAMALLSRTLSREKLLQESESTIEDFSVTRCLLSDGIADFRNLLLHPSSLRALPWASISKAWLSSCCLRSFQYKSSLLPLLSSK